MSVDIEADYRRFGPMVLRRCRELLRVEEDAVDAMHDIFVQLLRRQDTLTDEAPSSLLYHIATHVCLNRLRTQRRHPAVSDEYLLAGVAVPDRTEARSLARQLLGKLFADEPRPSRVALLHLHEGWTHQEVAAEVGLSVSGVRQHLRRLKARLGELEGAQTSATQ